MQRAMNAPLSEEQLVEIVQLATIVEEHTLWPRTLVDDARWRLAEMCGQVPSLEQLAEHASVEQVYGLAARVIEERDRVQREIDEELAEGNPCHLCGGFRDHNDLDYMFGLAKMLSQRTHWGGAVAAVALNALTIPLGAVVAALPGSTQRAYVKQCRLVMCAACGNKRKGGFWNNHELKVTARDCANHPSWNRLQAAGFTTFLDHRRVQQFH
jgi:hypothetical protein